MEAITEVKGLVQEMGTAFEEFKATHAKNLKERDSLLETKLVKLAEDITATYEKAQKQIDAAQKHLDELSLKGTNPERGTADTEKWTKQAIEFTKARIDRMGGRINERTIDTTAPQLKEYCDLFLKYCKYGPGFLDHIEHKAMSIGSDPDGGYFILPPEIDKRITTRVFETTPMRKVASVQPISTHEYKIPQDPNQFSAGWIGETATRPTTATATVAMKTITAYELYAEPQISQQLLEDAAVDFEQWISVKVADIIARTENTAFVNGVGSFQPRGFLTYPSGTNWGQIQQVGTGTSGAFTYSGLINIITSIKDKYQDKAQWMIKRASIASIMLLTDGSNRLIFQPILNGNFNETPLLGYPINYANDMPAIGAGSLSAAFGDFSAGYQIVDRVGISVLRDNLTAKPNVLFYTRKRTGGDVNDFDAIKLQVLT